MSVDLDAWPSLRGLKDGGSLRPQRAIWGKMHRASTDSRWIALTEGFDPTAELGIRALTVSVEDEPADAIAWKPQGSGYMAIRAYPSRARDAAGRSGGLEKQLLYARADSALPPAAAAFFLLDAAALLNDSVWWDSWNDSRWEDYRYQLPLPPEPELQWSRPALADRAARGLAELRSRIAAQALAEFYQDVLNSKSPALLTVNGDKLGPAAAAALLLPLQPALAARVSLLCGLPDSRLMTDRLTAWSGVVSRFRASIPAAPPGSNARRMADAVLSGAQLASPDPVERPRTAQRLIDFLDSSESRVLCVTRDNWRVLESPAQASDLINRIRRLDQDLETDGAFPNDAERRRARIDHLRVKYDQARSWLYAFAPGPETLRQLPPRPASPVPALRFACLMEPVDWPALGRYTEQDWLLLLEHSQKDGRLDNRVHAWLEEFRASAPVSAQTALQRYLR